MNDEQKELCEGMFTEEEYKHALELLKYNKSPGTDSLTVELYREFWANIKSLFIQLMDRSFKEGELSINAQHLYLDYIQKRRSNKFEELETDKSTKYRLQN